MAKREASESPGISVIMPVRDGEAWLAQSIASVLSQDFEDFELLVIDDGSEDGTSAILQHCARDPRLRVIRQPRQGLVVALNRAIAEARAPVLARLDADDRAMRERLGRQHAFLQSRPDVVLLGSSAEVVDESGKVVGHASPPTDGAALTRRLARSNPFVHSSVMMRTEPVHRLGGYRAAFRAAEDYDLWLRLSEIGGIANLPDCLVQYRRHAANLSRQEAVRQSFSVRLARRSAAARRSGAVDPALELHAPPDWWAEDARRMFFADDVGFYRFLDADAPAAPALVGEVRRSYFRLNHTERRLAQMRLKQLSEELGSSGISHRLRILGLMMVLHPPRAAKLMIRS